MASSGRRFDPSHSAATSFAAIIDPSTNAPVCTVVRATVRAPSCMLADALTKVVMIQGGIRRTAPWALPRERADGDGGRRHPSHARLARRGVPCALVLVSAG